MRGYHFRKTGKGRVVRRVPRPRSVRAGLALGWALDWDWRVELLDARRIEAVLRKRRFTFCDVQLLPEVAASRGEALEGFVRAGVGESSGGVRVSIDRICGDAEPCASVDERAKDGRQMEFTFGEGEEELKAFWQERFYDFNVYRDGKVKEKLNYMHANPVIRGLVEHPRDWSWSSWGHYAKGEKGLVEIDTWEN